MEKTIVNLEEREENEKRLFLKIADALKGIRYGYVQITVHASRIVQIDKTKKIRVDRQNTSKTEGGELR